VLENRPITVNKLAAMGSAGLSPAIPPGMRLMSVKVNDVSGVAGFVVWHASMSRDDPPPDR
jgi:Flp pilus assembly protein CpaB